MNYGNYPDLSHVKKILVVKLRHLGDVLLSSPVFSALKNHLPKAKIDAYIYEEAFPMLEGHPAISTLIGYDRNIKKLSLLSRMRKEWEILRRIRKEKYDLVINLTEGDRGAIVCRLSKAKICVGYDPENKGFFGKKKIYSHIVKKCHTLRHTVERNLDSLRVIGIFPEREKRALTFTLPPEILGKTARFLEEMGFSSQGFYLIHPTSRWRFKCWPEEKVKELVKRLLDQGNQVILTSGKEEVETEMVRKILSGLSHPHLLNLSGKVSLKELGALIFLSRSLLCVDSVSFHIASALQKRVVALFGPTSDVTWGPWQNPHAKVVAQNFSCRPCYSDGCAGSKRSDCLHTLAVEQVLSALEELNLNSAQR